MLKIYLRKSVEKYLQEVDLINAANIVMIDVEDLLIEIIEDIIVEIFIENFFLSILLCSNRREK